MFTDVLVKVPCILYFSFPILFKFSYTFLKLHLISIAAFPFRTPYSSFISPICWSFTLFINFIILFFRFLIVKLKSIFESQPIVFWAIYAIHLGIYFFDSVQIPTHWLSQVLPKNPLRNLWVYLFICYVNDSLLSLFAIIAVVYWFWMIFHQSPSVYEPKMSFKVVWWSDFFLR